MTQSSSDRIILTVLLILCVAPALGGIARMTELAGGAAATPENARFLAAPIPIAAHIVAAISYSILGAFQFIASFRRRNRNWHRVAGRVLIPLGFMVALTGLWMTITYPWAPNDGEWVYMERLVFGTAMLVSLVLGVDAIRRRRYAEHGEWMLRAYAIAMGAATQVLTHLPWFLFVDMHPGENARAVMLGLGWVINVALAEAIIRRHSIRSGMALSQAR